jgi:hypothetical protein
MPLKVSKLFLFIGSLLIFGAIGDISIRSFPPRFLNPEWELQTLGFVADSTPLLVVSLVLVALSKATSILDGKDVFQPSKLFARLCLLLTLVYAFSIPLVIVDSYRLNNRISGTITRQQKAQLSQVTSLESAINNQLTDRQINQLERRLSLPNNTSADEVKRVALERIKTQRDSLIKTSQNNISASTSRLVASAIRNILSFVIGIGCFLLLFKNFSK